MFNYAQVLDGKVLAISESPSKMVEIGDVNTRLLGTYYVDGDFIGYNIVLSSDKSEIIADGQDAAEVTATIFNWDGTQAADFTDEIHFIAGENAISAIPADGIATITFTSADAGVFMITCGSENPYIMDGGNIEITAAVGGGA